jgi:CRISP-associated protein Cas1
MKNYYVLSNGRVRRENNTIYIENADGQKRPLPVEDVDSLYLFGEIDLNTRLLNFLTQKHITLHVFNYYGFYAGSYYPREYLHSGYLLVQQVSHYSDTEKRHTLAREIVRGAAHSLLRNLSYYERRRGSAASDDTDTANPVNSVAPADSTDPPEATETALDTALLLETLTEPISPETDDETTYLPVTSAPATEPASIATVRQTVAGLAALTETVALTDINTLRGLEGKMRERYYSAWQHILTGDWDFERRVRRPPNNEINALISFGNSHLYTICLSEIYRTQLTSTISYLHEPGARRHSLALDLSEIFKPLIVDRVIFTLLNKGQLKENHFDRSMERCYLNDAGRKLFISALDERLAVTIHHRRLNRSVSYRHLTGLEPYRAFRAWW